MGAFVRLNTAVDVFNTTRVLGALEGARQRADRAAVGFGRDAFARFRAAERFGCGTGFNRATFDLVSHALAIGADEEVSGACDYGGAVGGLGLAGSVGTSEGAQNGATGSGQARVGSGDAGLGERATVRGTSFAIFNHGWAFGVLSHTVTVIAAIWRGLGAEVFGKAVGRA